jgi:transcriptional regulator with XRE-family HTH domain
MRQLRLMHQSELGAKCGWDGTTIAHIERGRFAPNVKSLIRLADVLEVSTDFLLGRHAAYSNPAYYRKVRV